MTNSMRRTLPAAALALAALSACGGPGTPAEARAEAAARGKGDIVVAAVWPWETRDEILYGQGLDLAVNEINAAGGINGRRLRLQREDDHGSVNEGLLVAQRLVANPEVSAVIGHLQSYVTVPAASVYDVGGMLMLSPASTAPGLTSKGYNHVFRTIFTDEETGRQMADFAAQRGYRRVGIFYVRNDYGRALANAFEERAGAAGLQVAARASYDAGSAADGRGYEATVRQWRQLELDAVFLAGQVPDAGQVIAELRRQGITAPVLGSDAMSSPALVQAGGAAVEGTVVPAPFHPSEPRPEVRRFAEAFRARYGKDPDPGSALGYDAVRVLARAMAGATSTAPGDVARSLRAMQPMPGVTGPLAFDERGELRARRMVKLVVRNGVFEYLPEENR